jgi:hypothetical protein
LVDRYGISVTNGHGYVPLVEGYLTAKNRNCAVSLVRKQEEFEDYQRGNQNPYIEE